MNFKPTFITSDWHTGHPNVLKFDKRPFNTIDEMHEALIKRYNSTVPKSGVCFFLGDMGNHVETLRNIMSRLNGTKVLVWGNHDKGVNTMYNCGFDIVVNSIMFYVQNQRVTMSHCPLRGILREDTSKMKGSHKHPFENWHGESRKKHQRCTITDEGQFHLHGHIHSRKDKPESEKILDKQYDVGVTANNFTPVSISQIESWIANYGRK